MLVWTNFEDDDDENKYSLFLKGNADGFGSVVEALSKFDSNESIIWFVSSLFESWSSSRPENLKLGSKILS